ncbi:MAG: hypothetical protein ACTHOF_02070 [Flavisolibacter sp.]
MMTNEEFETIKKAYKILDKLTDDQTINSVDSWYWSNLNEAYDGIAMLVDHINGNRKKLVKD